MNILNRMVEMVSKSLKQAALELGMQQARINLIDYICDAERMLKHGGDVEAYKAFCKLGISERNEVFSRTI